MKVTVVGTGYVGLTTALSLAYLGHNVIGIDKDEQKIALLLEEKSPIHETGIEVLLKEVRHNLYFTSNTVETVGLSEIIVIAVGTPSRPDGSADTQFVENAVREIAEGFLDGHTYIIVMKSTVPIGTNRRVQYVIETTLREKAIKAEFFVASNPEFLREGMALWYSFFPDRLVIGSESSEAIEKIKLLFKPILEQTFSPPAFIPRPQGYQLPPLIITDPTSSEMIKYAANAFLATKISFVNEIAGLCEKVGADIVEVTRGIGADPRIGSRFLQAGLGWGGSCFPKDTKALQALANEYDYSLPILKAACEINQRQIYLIIEMLQKHLKVLRGRTIGILGLAFKPNTDDIRDAPALEIIKDLLTRDANIKVHDPIAMVNMRKVLDSGQVEYCEDPYVLANQCDAIVIATEWEAYRHLDYSRIKTNMRSPILIDARNCLDSQEIRALGMIYNGIGRV
jgi:UDPglucose 6-dehydrogenase